MKRKGLIIGGGILLAVFILFLILIGGGSTTKNIPTQDTLTTVISGVTCKVEGEDDVIYDVKLLTNDIQFDSEIKAKNYNKIIINHSQNLESLGVAFMVKTKQDSTLNIQLCKNDEVLQTFSKSSLANEVVNVDLLMELPVEISSTDEYSIKVTSTSDFTFDTLLFFLQER